MGKKFFISCDEATTICDKSQYGEASLYDRIRLTVHMVICGDCKQYSKQNNMMTSFLSKFATPCESATKMEEKDKQELKERLEKELSN